MFLFIASASQHFLTAQFLKFARLPGPSLNLKRWKCSFSCSFRLLVLDCQIISIRIFYVNHKLPSVWILNRKKITFIFLLKIVINRWFDSNFFFKDTKRSAALWPKTTCLHTNNLWNSTHLDYLQTIVLLRGIRFDLQITWATQRTCKFVYDIIPLIQATFYCKH